MSDITAPSNATTNGKPPVEYEVSEFEEGDFKGFKFTHPTFNTLAAVAEVYGEEKALSLINVQVQARIRTKVKNGLPKDIKPIDLPRTQQELLTKNPGGILFTQEAAASWRPEVRELSPNQLFKRAKEAFAEASTEADPEKKMALMAKGQQFLVEMGKVMVS